MIIRADDVPTCPDCHHPAHDGRCPQATTPLSYSFGWRCPCTNQTAPEEGKE